MLIRCKRACENDCRLCFGVETQLRGGSCCLKLLDPEIPWCTASILKPTSTHLKCSDPRMRSSITQNMSGQLLEAYFSGVGVLIAWHLVGRKTMCVVVDTLIDCFHVWLCVKKTTKRSLHARTQVVHQRVHVRTRTRV